MGSYSGGFNYWKTAKSITLVSIVVSLALLPLLPLNKVAGVVSITVETDKTTYVPSEGMLIFGHAAVDAEPLTNSVVNITIRFINETVLTDDTTTDESGFFSLELGVSMEPREYEVVANITYTDAFGNTESAWDSVAFEVVEEIPGDVTVNVYGPGDTALADANVILYDHLTGGWVNNTLTNATGVAVMTIPTAKRFDVLIYKTGYGENVSGEVRGFLFDNNASSGYSSPCVLNFSLTSADYGTLNGTITNATDNAALANATVSMLAHIRGDTYWVNSTTTLSNGSYNTDLNLGLWKIWVDRAVDGNLTHLGTWSDVLMTAGASETWNASLWPKAQLKIEGVWANGTLVDWGTVVLINDTYGGVLWRRDFSFNEVEQGQPINVDMPAAKGLLLVMSQNGKKYVYSSTIDASDGGTVTLNVTLSENQYEIWSFPNDWQPDRLLGNLTMVAFVVVPETAMPEGPDGGGPPQFTDPDGDLYYYLMLDRGSEIPTTWQTKAMATRTDVGSYYQFFGLDTMEAPEGYYMCITLIKNSTGHVIAAQQEWFNRFQYQIQPIQVKGTYDVGEDVDVRFKVYGATGYVDDIDVTYGLFDSNLGWRLVRGGAATVNSTTKVWNVTVSGGILSPSEYNLAVRVVGGREYMFKFKVQEHTPIMFGGRILANASIDLWSDLYNQFIVTANETGFFNVTLPPTQYDAWFHYDNKDTPGMDARDTWMQLSLATNVSDFPNEPGFEEYLWRPMQPVFEVTGIAFHDANNNGVLDDGEDRLAEVNVRAANISGWEEWVPPTFPDGSYRLFLTLDQIYRLKATKSIYSQNKTATPEIGADASQGDLVTINIPMVPLVSGNITGYVKLDNGTLLEDASVNFMDEYWSWLGSTFTNSSGGYLFTVPANKKLNIWVSPPQAGGQGIGGKDVPGVMVGENQTLYLNITLHRTAMINGTIQLNGTDIWAQIMPLDENWNRVSWDWGEYGYFETEVPTSAKKLLIWSWENGFLIEDVDLQAGVTNDLGILNLMPTDNNISIDAHPLNWEWDWSVGQYVNFTVELRDQQNDWQPISGANLTFWAWYENNGTLIEQGTVTESDPIMAPGIYEDAFLVSSSGHYRLFIVANVTGNRVTFTDLWISATNKKLFILEAQGEYGLADVQSGNAKVRVKLLNTADGNAISGYDVWYEIRGFTDMQTWQMETVVTRTSASDLGSGVYEVTLPSVLNAGEYWMEIVAGDWETSRQLGFRVSKNATPTVNIYGWATKGVTPVDGATVEAWMEAMPYLFVTTTNASGYFSLPVPEKNVYHLHIFDDNATTTGIDYTTIPEWERIEVKVIDVLHNATLARVEKVTLTIMQKDQQGIPQPVNAEVLAWDVSTSPPQLMMWAGTWRGPGLFEEKLTEGTYVFEIRSWDWPQWYYWSEPKNVSAEPPPDSFEITVPTYDIILETWADTGGAWRVKPGDNITISIYEYDLQQQGLNASYLQDNCEKKFEIFHWVPGKMARAYSYNVTWTLKEAGSEGVQETHLETNFTMPTYFTGGEFEIQISFYNVSEQAPKKVFVIARTHMIIAPIDIGLSVVPYSAEINDTVIAVVVIASEGAPASGVNVEFEIYDAWWQVVTVEAGEEISSGIYVATFTVPGGYEPGWWTVKAIATMGAKQATAFEGFDVTPG